jgi:hypothetical protein
MLKLQQRFSRQINHERIGNCEPHSDYNSELGLHQDPVYRRGHGVNASLANLDSHLEHLGSIEFLPLKTRICRTNTHCHFARQKFLLIENIKDSEVCGLIGEHEMVDIVSRLRITLYSTHKKQRRWTLIPR